MTTGWLRAAPHNRAIPDRCQRCNDSPWTKRHRNGWYCAPCSALARADTCAALGVTPDIGFAVPVRRDTTTPDLWWCVCVTCPAEWVATPGQPCWRCEERVARQLDAHRRTALTAPPVLDERSTIEWEDRLQTAIDLGIVDREAAIDALADAFRAQQDKAS